MTLGWNNQVSWKQGAALSVFLLAMLTVALSLRIVGFAVTVGICLAVLIPATIVGRVRERRTETERDETASLLTQLFGSSQRFTRSQQIRSGVAYSIFGVALLATAIAVAADGDWVAAVALAFCSLFCVPLAIVFLRRP